MDTIEISKAVENAFHLPLTASEEERFKARVYLRLAYSRAMATFSPLTGDENRLRAKLQGFMDRIEVLR